MIILRLMACEASGSRAPQPIVYGGPVRPVGGRRDDDPLDPRLIELVQVRVELPRIRGGVL